MLITERIKSNSENGDSFIGVVFVIEHRQAIERNVTAPLAFQIGQIADELKPDLFMALAARREGLSPDQSYLVWQAMLRVNHTIYSAFGNDGRAFKKLSHTYDF